MGHQRGVINFDDLQADRGYRFPPGILQSKLANLLFAYELQAGLAAAGAATIAVAAHPRQRPDRVRPGHVPRRPDRDEPRTSALTWWLMQSPPVAALATVRAATDPDAHGGDYYGPPGPGPSC